MKKKIISLVLFFCFLFSFIYAKENEYSSYMTQGEKYETEKKWCHALAMYYDALCTDDAPELKEQAYVKFNELSELIKSGYPGKGKFNDFSLHDGWKALLIDAEIVLCSFCKFEELEISDFKKGELDYNTRTAIYYVSIDSKRSCKYEKLVEILREGYAESFKDDWKHDLPNPDDWPSLSVSYNRDDKYDINGALVVKLDHRKDYRILSNENESLFYNAFCTPYFHRLYTYNYDPYGYYLPEMYDCKFNLVDENGVELVKGKRWLIDSGRFKIEGVDEKLMEKIESGEVYLNLQKLYIEYGKTINDDYNKDNVRACIKNLPEKELSVSDILVKKKGDNSSYYKTVKFNEAILYWTSH